MDDWLDRFADALGVPRLGQLEIDAILDLARDVAHATERRNAPLAAFLAGRATAMRPTAVSDVGAALLVARESLPPPA